MKWLYSVNRPMNAFNYHHVLLQHYFYLLYLKGGFFARASDVIVNVGSDATHYEDRGNDGIVGLHVTAVERALMTRQVVMPVLFQEDDCVRATMTSLITSKLQLLLL
jgi:hypothetical protein